MSRGRRRGGVATALIDRSPQALPVPLGGTTPVRMLRPGRRHLVRRHARDAGLAAVAVLTLAGVVLLCIPEPVQADLDGDVVHVGAMSLRLQGVGAAPGPLTFRSAEATLVLVEPGGGRARATASWEAGGVVAVASCTLHAQAGRLVDECAFALGSSRLTSVDVLDPSRTSAWQRTYSDGVHVEIAVAPHGAAVPVPFPIGR